MALTRTDLKDATLLLKAGKIDIVRHILISSNDPRAVRLLAKLDKRVASQRAAAPEPTDGLAEIKQLLVQKRFAEAEVLLRASSHPKASYLLEKIALRKASAKAKPHKRSVLTSVSGMLSRFSQTAKRVILRSQAQS